MKSKTDTQYRFNGSECRVCQGDIFQDLDYDYRIHKDKTGKLLSVDKITLPYIIVLSQDCDLESDYRNRSQEDIEGKKKDKYLQSILICPAYFAEALKEGSHLSGPGLEIKMEYHNHDRWNVIMGNKNERYHFLDADLELQIPNLAIDFKHYFTIPRDLLYELRKRQYLASVEELHREAVSQRFAYYLSRIGLPEVTEANNLVSVT